ncbi:small nuclear protein [Cyclospora cayetanensis]|uniref:Small nuclear ribonucleoprotein Sm D3 n=1 Tax=Cyclospora cayetanensis TaxID=88456 RepID=A0A1D3CRH3_9EIME|nr:small nuclear protein [Cyclospora cayetanensis]
MLLLPLTRRPLECPQQPLKLHCTAAEVVVFVLHCRPREMAKVASVGIPVKLLHEGLGHTITVETKSGSLYRGILENAEDNMNILVQGVTVTYKDGKVLNLEQVYIRGSQGDEHEECERTWS